MLLMLVVDLLGSALGRERVASSSGKIPPYPNTRLSGYYRLIVRYRVPIQGKKPSHGWLVQK